MAYRLLMLALLVAVETGCPDTWGNEGYVQRTVFENVSKKDHTGDTCPLEPTRWRQLCGHEKDHFGSCPDTCPLPLKPEEK